MKLKVIPLIIIVAFLSIGAKIFHFNSGVQNKDEAELIAKYELMAADNEMEDEESEISDEDESSAEPEAYLSPNYSGGGPKEPNVDDLGDMEKNLLQNLVKRRKELENWSASISMKENILNATEKKINRKIVELKKLQDEVSYLLEKYQDKEDKKVKRLVKIYENMKADDAANIFEAMEISIILDIVSNMKEAKAAKIISKINPKKAKDITVRLANQNRLNVN